MAYSKTILLVVFAVLLITAEVSAHRDLLEKTTATTDGRSGYNRGGNGGYGGGSGGHEKPIPYETGGGNGGGKGGNGSHGNGAQGGHGGYGPETQN